MTSTVRVRDCAGAPTDTALALATASFRDLRLRQGLRVGKGQTVGTLEWVARDGGQGQGARGEARLRLPEAGKVERVAVKAREKVDLE